MQNEQVTVVHLNSEVLTNLFRDPATLGDMNGDHKGEAIWTNEGADSGVDEFCDILIERPEFQWLIDETSVHMYEALNDFIHEFINDYANEINPEAHFNAED